MKHQNVVFHCSLQVFEIWSLAIQNASYLQALQPCPGVYSRPRAIEAHSGDWKTALVFWPMAQAAVPLQEKLVPSCQQVLMSASTGRVSFEILSSNNTTEKK